MFRLTITIEKTDSALAVIDTLEKTVSITDLSKYSAQTIWALLLGFITIIQREEKGLQ